MAGAYSRSAAVYDAIYRGRKNYAAEAEEIHAILSTRMRSDGRRLLDIACGTGGHIPHLSRFYDVEGLDYSAEMLAVARERHPSVTFHQGDMTGFDLGRRFDAVLCLFGSIGYVKTPERLSRSLRCFADHTVLGGVVFVDGWCRPDQWRDIALYAALVDEPELKVARITRNTRAGDLSLMEWHHIVATPERIESFVEHHEMGLFTPEQYLRAFAHAGLAEISYDPDAADGRGRYIGVRPG